jgi:hypothetical protein
MNLQTRQILRLSCSLYLWGSAYPSMDYVKAGHCFAVRTAEFAVVTVTK